MIPSGSVNGGATGSGTGRGSRRPPKCNKCGEQVCNPVFTFSQHHEEYRHVKCSRCQLLYHAHCTDIQLDRVWCNMGVYQRVWKCYNCLNFPPTEADKLMNEKMSLLHLGEMCSSLSRC